MKSAHPLVGQRVQHWAKNLLKIVRRHDVFSTASTCERLLDRRTQWAKEQQSKTAQTRADTRPVGPFCARVRGNNQPTIRADVGLQRTQCRYTLYLSGLVLPTRLMFGQGSMCNCAPRLLAAVAHRFHTTPTVK